VTAIARNAHIAGRHALYRTVSTVENFSRCKAREDFNPQIFRLPCQPAAKIAQRAGISALVVHETGSEKMRHVKLAGLAHDPVLVVVYRRFGEGTALLAPIGNKFVQCLWIDYRSGQNMRANF
jgi:hypothetical protein